MTEYIDGLKPKVQVIQIPWASPEILSEAQDFAAKLRQTLGLPLEKGFYGSDLYNGAAALDLKPVAVGFISAFNHWNLITSVGEGPRSHVFDPRIGLSEIDNSLIKGIYFVDIFGIQRRLKDPKELLEINYEIPEYKLQGVGKVQIQSADCGPLCLWAAKRALDR